MVECRKSLFEHDGIEKYYSITQFEATAARRAFPSSQILGYKGPIHLVQAGLINQVEELGWHVVFDGHHQFEDISPPPNGIQVNATSDAAIDTLNASIMKLRSPLFIAQVCESVASAVQAHAEMGHLLVTLGGDRSLAMGTISGTLRAYDQACLNPPAPSPDSVLAKFDWVTHLPAERLVYISLRDVDKGEKEILKKHGIKAFGMHEINRYGIGKVVEMVLDYVNPQRDHHIHLSFDFDALDLSVAPSMGTSLCDLSTFGDFEVNPALADAESVCQTVTVSRLGLRRHPFLSMTRIFILDIGGNDPEDVLIPSRKFLEQFRSAKALSEARKLTKHLKDAIQVFNTQVAAQVSSQLQSFLKMTADLPTSSLPNK
ncbi:hypothetical protein EV702DRAFT_1049141 [Suillus placidus]|uniref:Arginase n=1 Tax=Suillus placidus TaxID=48579 RepID=A0A9P6ZLF9_9AGAM|nr:hypothetical protein EV702DRAFT_1049141 [Suillus placidus]